LVVARFDGPPLGTTLPFFVEISCTGLPGRFQSPRSQSATLPLIRLV